MNIKIEETYIICMYVSIIMLKKYKKLYKDKYNLIVTVGDFILCMYVCIKINI
jgi:hypothetical protein